jgi:hypothetical protein
MRLIYQHGQKIGPNPKRFYVYLWSHNGLARYVGKGGGSHGRWSDHLLRPNRSSDFPLKYRGFREHGHEMTCHVLAEGLKEDEAAQSESIEIDRHGLLADETGTLWNRQRTSTAPAARTRAEKPWSRAKFNVRLWRQLMAEGPFTPGATIRRVINHNPKKEGSAERQNFDLYPPPGEPVSVADHNDRAFKDHFTKTNQRGHLAWNYVHGFVAVTLPDSETVVPNHICEVSRRRSRSSIKSTVRSILATVSDRVEGAGRAAGVGEMRTDGVVANRISPAVRMLMIGATMRRSARDGNDANYVVVMSKYFDAYDLLAPIYDGRFYLGFSMIKMEQLFPSYANACANTTPLPYCVSMRI